jgi:hypothetical protein
MHDGREGFDVERFVQQHERLQMPQVVRVSGRRGDDQHGNPTQALGLAHRGEDFDAVHPGEDEIEHDEGRRIGVHEGEGFRPVRGADDLEPVENERVFNEPAQLVVVFDDNDRPVQRQQRHEHSIGGAWVPVQRDVRERV